MGQKTIKEVTGYTLEQQGYVSRTSNKQTRSYESDTILVIFSPYLELPSASIDIPSYVTRRDVILITGM